LLRALGAEWASAPRSYNGLSFADLQRLARDRGYPTLGVSLALDDLSRLRQPALVALTVSGRQHFSVLRGVDPGGAVHLADPSWGNRRLAPAEFATYFLRPTDLAHERSASLASHAAGSEPPKGRILLVGRHSAQASERFMSLQRMPVHLPPAALRSATRHSLIPAAPLF
jgi:hypothetical protein